MTSLKCSAHNCCYNKNSLCSRGSISVEGADARYADDTACESFRDQEECAVKNSADPCCGCETINIDCKAPTMSTANAPQLPSMYPVTMHIAAVIQNVILSAANADILNRNPVSIQSRHSCFF